MQARVEVFIVVPGVPSFVDPLGKQLVADFGAAERHDGGFPVVREEKQLVCDERGYSTAQGVARDDEGVVRVGMGEVCNLFKHVVVDLLGTVVEPFVDGAAPAVTVEGEVLSPALFPFAEKVVRHWVDLEVHEPLLVGGGPLKADDDLVMVIISEEHAGDGPSVDVFDVDVSRGARAEHGRTRCLQVPDND